MLYLWNYVPFIWTFTSNKMIPRKCYLGDKLLWRCDHTVSEKTMTFIRGFSAAVWHSQDYPPDSSKGLQDYKSQNEKIVFRMEGNMLQTFEVFLLSGVHYSWAYHLKILLSSLYFRTLLTFNLPWLKKIKKTPCCARKAIAILSSHVRQKANMIWFESTQ